MPLSSGSGGGPIPVPVGLSVSGGIPGMVHTSGGINVPTGMPGSGVLQNNVGLPGNDGLSGSGGLSNSGLPVSLQSGLPTGLSDNTTLPPRPNPLGAVDPLSSSNENETIKTLLRQLATKQQTQQ